MTVDEAIDTIRTVTMGDFGIPVEIQGIRRGSANGSIGLGIYVTIGPVKNACEDGPPIRVSDVDRVSADTLAGITPRDLVLGIVWPAVKRIVLHEAAEHFRVGGVQVCDPHVKDRR